MMKVFAFLKMIVWRPIYSILLKPIFFTNARKAFSTVFNMKDATSLSGLRLYDIIIFERIRFHSLSLPERAQGFSAYFTRKHDLALLGLDNEAKKDTLKALLSDDSNWMYGEVDNSLANDFGRTLDLSFNRVYLKRLDWLVDDIGFRKKCAKKVNKLCKQEIKATVLILGTQSRFSEGSSRKHVTLSLSAIDFNCLAKVFYRNHVSRPLYLKSPKAFLTDLIPALCFIPLSLLNYLKQVVGVLLFTGVLGLMLGVILFVVCLVFFVLLFSFPLLCLAENNWKIAIEELNKWLMQCKNDLPLKSKLIKTSSGGKALLTMRFSAKIFFFTILLKYLELGSVGRGVRKNPLYWIGCPVYLIVIFLTAPLVYPFWSRWAGVKLYVEYKNNLNILQKSSLKVEKILCHQMKSANATSDSLETNSSSDSHQLAGQSSISNTVNAYLQENTVRVDAINPDCSCPICFESPFKQNDDNAHLSEEVNDVAPCTPTQANVFGLAETGNIIHQFCFKQYCEHEKKQHQIADNEDYVVKNPLRSDEWISSKLIEINQIKPDLKASEIFHVSALCPLTGKPFGNMKRADRLTESGNEKDSSNKAEKAIQSPEPPAAPFMWSKTKIQPDALYFFPKILIPDIEASLVGMCFSGEVLVQLMNTDMLAQHKLKQKLKQKHLLECLGKPALLPKDGLLEKTFFEAGELYTKAIEERNNRFNRWLGWSSQYCSPGIYNSKMTVLASESAQSTENGNQQKAKGVNKGEAFKSNQSYNQDRSSGLNKRGLGLDMASDLKTWSSDKLLIGKIRSSFFSAASQFSDRDCVTKKIKEVLGENNEKTSSDEAALPSP